MTPREERERRGGDAKRLMNEPLLIEAFDTIEKSAIEAILTATTDEERRVNAHRAKAIRDLRSELESVIAQGNEAVRSRPSVA